MTDDSYDRPAGGCRFTSDSDVVRGEGGWGFGDPLGHGLARGVEHEVGEGEGAIVYSE